GSLSLRSRDTVALRVVARDEYGNRAALDGFAATTTRGGRALRLKSTVADSAAVVTLEPRRTGAGALTLSASALRTRRAVDGGPRGAVSPGVSVAAGGYRLQSGDNGQTVYHTNAFWSGGSGVDVVVSPSVIVEVRVERQWLRDTNQGHVATLWPVAAGVRVAL